MNEQWYSLTLIFFGCIPKLNFRYWLSVEFVFACLSDAPISRKQHYHFPMFSTFCISVKMMISHSLVLFARKLTPYFQKLQTKLDDITSVFSKNVYFRYGIPVYTILHTVVWWNILLCIVTLILYNNILHRHSNCWCQFCVCVFCFTVSVA